MNILQLPFSKKYVHLSVDCSRLPSCHGQSGRSSDSPPFLGIELDSVLLQMRLPPDKLREILEELTNWQSYSKTTQQKLLSLIGKLAFAARAVPAGRLFIRRLITLSTKAKRLHHRIHLNSDARADSAWWQEFLPMWNGTAQFVDQQPTDAADLEQLKMVLRGTQRANLDRTSHPRQPITRTILHKLLYQARYSHKLHKHDKHMLTAAFLLAFFWLLASK